MTLNKAFFKAILLLHIMLLSGCTGVSTPARFYLLEPIELTSEIHDDPTIIQIALAQVKTPDYVNRPQIVTAVEKNQYQLSEINRWAEPLDKNLTRVLKQNLAMLVPAEVEVVYAESLAKQANFYLVVEILDLYMNSEAEVTLNAHWDLYQMGRKTENHQHNCQSGAAENNYSGMVAALNQCYRQLSITIANSINSIKKQPVLQKPIE